VHDLAEEDGGESLLRAALLPGEPLEVLSEVRPNLDLVPGGAGIDTLATFLTLRTHGAVGDLESRHDLDGVKRRFEAALDDPATTHFDAVEQALRTISDRYDLIVIDTPPTDTVISISAFVASQFLLIPTKADAASIMGLGRVAERFARVRAHRNPALTLLGVVLFDFAVQETRLIDEARRVVASAVNWSAPVFHRPIRSSRRAAFDMREAGLIAVEYAQKASSAVPWYVAKRNGGQAERFSSAASSLADDYVALTTEILQEFSDRLAGLPPSNQRETRGTELPGGSEPTVSAEALAHSGPQGS
jgi:chromosome partitioning protein